MHPYSRAFMASAFSNRVLSLNGALGHKELTVIKIMDKNTQIRRHLQKKVGGENKKYVWLSGRMYIEEQRAATSVNLAKRRSRSKNNTNVPIPGTERRHDICNQAPEGYKFASLVASQL